MSVAFWLWSCAGLAAGAAHAGLLWDTAHRWRRPRLLALWRMPAVAAVLIASAMAGQLLAAAGAWAAGLAGAGALLALRSRQ